MDPGRYLIDEPCIIGSQCACAIKSARLCIGRNIKTSVERRGTYSVHEDIFGNEYSEKGCCGTSRMITVHSIQVQCGKLSFIPPLLYMEKTYLHGYFTVLVDDDDVGSHSAHPLSLAVNW